MTRKEILEEMMDRDLEYVILADGFEDAFLGVSATKPIKVVYDYWKCLDLIIKRDNAGFDEAMDWLEEFIQEELGQHAPLYIKQIQ